MSFLFLFIPAVLSAESLESPPNPTDEKLPDIEARTYPVRVVTKSNSNRVFLFENLRQGLPQVGRIWLLKIDSEPVMAFRIIKLYPDDKKIAAKRIKKFGNYQTLESGEKYTAIEKISDIATPPPTQEDHVDLKEIETKEHLKVLPYDPDLDGPPSPPIVAAPPPVSELAPMPESPPEPTLPGETVGSETSKTETQSDRTPDSKQESTDDEEDDRPDEDEDLDDLQKIVVEEIQPIDRYNQWLTVSLGFLRNTAPPNPAYSMAGFYLYSSGGIRYGMNIAKLVLLDGNHAQDSLTPEIGGFLYKATSYVTTGDAYLVGTLMASLRYNIHFSESFSIFFQAGALKNYILSSSLASASGVSALSTLLPVGGMGLFVRVGPNWYTRIDIGIDMIDAGLVLRF